MRPYAKELNVAVKAARQAGTILMRLYGRTRRAFKKDSSIVTKADLCSEQCILRLLRKHFPSYAILSEEAGGSVHGHTWVIDPLDGTTNFSMQNPFFNVSIGLVHKDVPVMGVVYNPYTKELFHAVEGQGAFLNGKRIRCATQGRLNSAIVGFCHGHKPAHLQRGIRIYANARPFVRLRQFGSAALELSYVAAGRIDAFYMTDMNAYDVAAGAVIAKEAGCRVTDFEGAEFTLRSRDIMAASDKMYTQLAFIRNSPP